jgi:hypothetical protein
MATAIIPVRSDLPHHRLHSELDGVTYTLDLDWNQTDGHWYMTVGDKDGQPLAAGVRVVVGWPLASRALAGPAGVLIAVDTSGQELDPSAAELGGRVQLLYVEAADVAALADG